jgi:hypothetical protein
MPGGSQGLDVSADFYSSFYRPCFVQSSHQGVFAQNPINQFVHRVTPKLLQCNIRSASFRFSGVTKENSRAYFATLRTLMLTPSRLTDANWCASA